MPHDLLRVILSHLDFRSSLFFLSSTKILFNKKNALDSRYSIPRYGLGLWLAADSGVKLQDEDLVSKSDPRNYPYSVPEGKSIAKWEALIGPSLFPDLKAGQGSLYRQYMPSSNIIHVHLFL